MTASASPQERRDLDSPMRGTVVNHPDHYNASPSGVECITVVEHMTFNLGNAVKYIWRAGIKGDLLTDLEKAKFYVEREIQRVKMANLRGAK